MGKTNKRKYQPNILNEPEKKKKKSFYSSSKKRYKNNLDNVNNLNNINNKKENNDDEQIFIKREVNLNNKEQDNENVHHTHHTHWLVLSEDSSFINKRHDIGHVTGYFFFNGHKLYSAFKGRFLLKNNVIGILTEDIEQFYGSVTDKVYQRLKPWSYLKINIFLEEGEICDLGSLQTRLYNQWVSNVITEINSDFELLRVKIDNFKLLKTKIDNYLY